MYTCRSCTRVCILHLSEVAVYTPLDNCTVFLVAKKLLHDASATRARVSVNFRKFSPYIAPSLALFPQIKQKYQKWIIHRKLRTTTFERVGKLSNPRARRARAMHGENLRKFTETRAGAPRASCTNFSVAKNTVRST